MYAHGKACRSDQDRVDTGAYRPIDSMVRESYDGIIGGAPSGAIPLGRMSTVRDSLRQSARSVTSAVVTCIAWGNPCVSRLRSNHGGDDEQTPEQCETAGVVPAEPERGAGIDVGATSHYVAVTPSGPLRPEAEQTPVRKSLRLSRRDLYRLADWLAECGVATVVMESTGVYWIPRFGVLEERGFEVMLVDPRRIKNVPGRKTDVVDCQWRQQLHTYGLLSGAFRPDGEIRRLRSYLRQRAMLVQYASHHIQHMQQALTQLNVKLQHVIRDITGQTGMDIMEAIVGGERDPRKLARLRDPRIKADAATIARSLQGHWREEHSFELTQALELYRAYQGRIAACDREIEAQLERFEDRSDGQSPAPNGKKRNQKNAPRFDVQSHL